MREIVSSVMSVLPSGYSNEKRSCRFLSYSIRQSLPDYHVLYYDKAWPPDGMTTIDSRHLLHKLRVTSAPVSLRIDILQTE